jgi:hypothetical protein
MRHCREFPHYWKTLYRQPRRGRQHGQREPNEALARLVGSRLLHDTA